MANSAPLLSARHICKYPDCFKPRYKEPTSGYTHDFCGRTHANMYMATYSTSPVPPPSSTYYKSAQKAKTVSKTIAPSSSSTKPSKPLKAFPSLPTKKASKEIKFYNSYDPYYEFTNFYRCGILVDGKDWPTSEHYFQAQKFVGTPYVEKIRKLPSAREAFQFSRDPSVSRWRRSDWDLVKDDIMLKVLRCKFEQREHLRTLLLTTGDKTLIEHTENDSYWGDGGGAGSNKLGNLLMQVRGELRSKYGEPKKQSRVSRQNSYPWSKYKDDMEVTSSSNLAFPLKPRKYGSLTNLSTLSSDVSPSSHRTSLTAASVPHRYRSNSLTRYSSPTSTTTATYSSAVSKPTRGTSRHRPDSPRRGNDSTGVKEALYSWI